jgi:hypothetical protein
VSERIKKEKKKERKNRKRWKEIVSMFIAPLHFVLPYCSQKSSTVGKPQLLQPSRILHIFFNSAVLTVFRFWSLPMEWRDVEHRILLPYPHGLVTYDEYTLCRKWREGQSKLSYC